jgi:hypothetical protein
VIDTEGVKMFVVDAMIGGWAVRSPATETTGVNTFVVDVINEGES